MFKWAFIGAGNIARVVAREITKTGRHCVVSVYSRSIEKATQFAKQFNATAFDELKSALLNVDGVYIATPHSCHYKYIIECLMMDKPVLCEKSFTVNSKQAKVAYELAKEREVYLSEAMWTRYNPVVKQIIDWVREGKIGQVECIKANFCVPMAIAKAFVSERTYLPQYAGGALLDLGVYPIAYSVMLLGKPDKVVCKGLLKNKVDYEENIQLIYDGKLKADLWSSIKSAKSYKSQIIGENGVITSPMFYRPCKAVLKSKIENLVVKGKAGYIWQFDQVANDILAGKLTSQQITPEDSIMIMEIMDECRRQLGLEYEEEIENI